MRNLILTVFLISLINPIVNAAELKLSRLFSDHMVLQRQVQIPIWGKDKPQQQITVEFAGQKATTITAADGKWMLKLDPIKAISEGQNMTIKGSDTITISDILVGEVWICSGQSNMQFYAKWVPEVKEITPLKQRIRAFDVRRTVSFKEEESVYGSWKTEHSLSAVSTAFSYYLEKLVDVPVGVIHASWGKSSIEGWMPRDLGSKLPYFEKLMTNFEADSLRKKKIIRLLEKRKNWSTEESIYVRVQPNIIYNAMLAPIIPYACKGLLWYQGESNSRHINTHADGIIGSKEYGHSLKTWIQDFREKWNNEEMHFMIVMLPGYGRGTVRSNAVKIHPEHPNEDTWAWMREAQLKALELPYTSVVNSIDLGHLTDIHPKDKLQLGERLVLLASKDVYGKNVVEKGPMMTKVSKGKKGKLIVNFSNAKGLKTIDGEAPKAFWLTDESKKWVRAKAQIVGETIVLTSDEIKKPKYIRYAFAAKPEVNLVNGADLPAYPFKTDTWYFE